MLSLARREFAVSILWTKYHLNSRENILRFFFYLNKIKYLCRRISVEHKDKHSSSLAACFPQLSIMVSKTVWVIDQELYTCLVMWVDPHIDVDLPQPAVCVTCGVITDKLKPRYPLPAFMGRICISSTTVQRSPSSCNRKFSRNNLVVLKNCSSR